jgi:hypothetical protein
MEVFKWLNLYNLLEDTIWFPYLEEKMKIDCKKLAEDHEQLHDAIERYDKVFLGILIC